MSKHNKLTPEEEHIIVDKGTEAPFSGEFNEHFDDGIYTCRRCSAPLYEANSKFTSECGWPSFDDAIPGMVNSQVDADGMRTEIICANCNGHLGHVFVGEKNTETDTRHCVNSLSMQFVSAENATEQLQIAVFASGCFWGTEYWFNQQHGVIATTVGYAGGHVAHPSYQEVCTGDTGHAESIRVFFDPREISYEDLVILFYNTHDPTQFNRQGPDIGTQYRSAIFTSDDEQAEIAEEVTQRLFDKGLEIATTIELLEAFYPERDLAHHKYYENKGSLPYCHVLEPKFE